MDDNKTSTDNVSYKLRELTLGLVEVRRVSSMLSWKHRFGNIISLILKSGSELLPQRVWMLVELSAGLETYISLILKPGSELLS